MKWRSGPRTSGGRLLCVAILVAQALLGVACERAAEPSAADSAAAGAYETTLEHSSEAFCLGQGTAASERFVVEGSLSLPAGEVRGARFTSSGNAVVVGGAR